jgi:hypothetical protein
MRCVLSAELTEFVSLQPIWIIFLVFHGRVIPLLAERTGHVDDFTHFLLRNASPVIRQSQPRERTPPSIAARHVTINNIVFVFTLKFR